MRTVAAIALALALLPATVRAIPPPSGSPEWDVLDTPAKRHWVANQFDRLGRKCCDGGDFATVTVRIAGDHYEVKANYPDPQRGIPSGWIAVPDEKIVPLGQDGNPIFTAAAWFYQGRVQCFLNGDGN